MSQIRSSLDRLPAPPASAELELISTYQQLRENLDTWSAEPSDRQKMVDLGQYYVYDSDSRTAAPCKFVAFRGMTLEYYTGLVQAPPARFDGNKAQSRLSLICGDPVHDSDALAAVASLRERLGYPPTTNVKVFSTRTINRLVAATRALRRGTKMGAPTMHKPLALLAAALCTVKGQPRFQDIKSLFLEFAGIAGAGRITANEPYTRLRISPSREFFWSVLAPDGAPVEEDDAPDRRLNDTTIQWEGGSIECLADPEDRRRFIEATLDVLGDGPAASLKQHPLVRKELDIATSTPWSPSNEPPTIGVEPAPDPDFTLKDIVTTFSQALASSNIRFGQGHESFVRTFVVSLATKRFVILTGLSGSGKTQIGLKFGHWLDRDRTLVVPVRPDWTGGEALFGYEDALGPRDKNGLPAWHVPDVLGFMLKAHDQPRHPYVLVLDEMNLAHVERYFADVLSGMESEEPCLPNLRQNTDGYWRIVPNESARIPIPKNLFVIGTVNVDETTYMFSPKVLDRANVLEVRVTTDDLSEAASKPTYCQKSAVGYSSSFLKIASSPAPVPDSPVDVAFRQRMREVHRLLSEDGFEFGHRVYHEATRFAALLASAGVDSLTEPLDLQVVQKILPRFHGSRRQLEPLLLKMARYTFSLDPSAAGDTVDPLSIDAGPAALTRSFDKVCRMLKRLRANQFVSFTE